MTSEAPARFQIRNLTQDENFGIDLEGRGETWRTVTVPALAIPVNRGGKTVRINTGDQLGRFWFFAGKPEVPAEIMLDRFEILEVEP